MDSTDISIRLAGAADMLALRRVAERDSRLLPHGELLVAEALGEVQAALSVQTGEFVADPFRPTAAMVELPENPVPIAGNPADRLLSVHSPFGLPRPRSRRARPPFPRTAAECAWTREHLPSD